YNILLKDDKSYPFIKITKEKHPKLIVTRTVKKGTGKYFGPYPFKFIFLPFLISYIFHLRTILTVFFNYG
ncbi:hypothetical protein KZX30_12680, partial [Staphylococcus haemolyticus]|nr:hypothetical protein [Staphylococcus haemolyticus]MCK6112926.1 hypothetical protein [Staphylococcus haemolyticus]MCK6170425.1 hypothetical protein [Staphylococcus haemolyticus]